MEIINVVGAAIIVEGKILIAKRSALMTSPGKWEFPGGKIEDQESPQEALEREIKEELSLSVKTGQFVAKGTSIIKNKQISLKVYFADLISPIHDLILNEHTEFCFVSPEELLNYEFPEADLPAVKRLASKEISMNESRSH